MRKLFKVITDLLLVVLIAFACVLFVPKLFGIKTYEVLSGSMEPTYHVGSVVYVNGTDPENIKTGDVITFHLNSTTLVTHRVVDKDESNRTFTTKGDANENADGSAVAYSNVVGKVVFGIPLLGYIASYVTNTSGLIIMITVILIIFIISFILDLLGKKDDDKKSDFRK